MKNIANSYAKIIKNNKAMLKKIYFFRKIPSHDNRNKVVKEPTKVNEHVPKIIILFIQNFNVKLINMWKYVCICWYAYVLYFGHKLIFAKNFLKSTIHPII